MSRRRARGGGGGDLTLLTGRVEPVWLEEEIQRSYLDYSMSVIVGRALPDARDGLKPVHRRILWSMLEGGLRPDRPYRKSAGSGGEVVKKYHPHGLDAVCDALVRVVQQHRQQGRRMVFTNGCFDLLHVGHMRYLQQARSFGDLLIVALNDDASVLRLKGEQRPLIPQAERASVLAALACVDYVTVFSEDTPLELIRLLRPDVLVKGGDYVPETVVGRDEVESYGGSVAIVPYVEGVSTTHIIDSVLKRYSP